MPQQYSSPLGTFVSWIDSERQRNRAAEDQDLDRRISLIHDMINSPGANPARTAEGIRGIIELQSARGGKGKQKGGLGGFMGEHEAVLPEFLADLIHGQAPFEGNTYSVQHQPLTQPPNSDVIPSTQIHSGGFGQPPAGVAEDSQPQAAGFSGQSALSSPVNIPPAPIDMPPTGQRMLDAGHQMQSQAQFQDIRVPKPPNEQPFRIAPDELAEQQGHAAGIKQTAISDAKTQAQIREWKQYFSDDEIKQMLQSQAHRGVNEYTGDSTPDILQDENGNYIYQTISTDKATGRPVVNRTAAPTGFKPAIKPGAGKTYSTPHFVQKPNGEWEVVYAPTDPANPDGIKTSPTGLVGRIPPAPQGNLIKVDGPNGPQYMRAQGTGVTPVKDASGAPVIPAAPDRPISAQSKQALTGINFMESTIPDVLQILGDPSKLSGSPIARSVQLALVQKGWAQGGQVEQLLQTLGANEAYGLRGLLGGARNMNIVRIIQNHLPQPGDSDKLTYEKLIGLQQLIPKIRDSIIRAESATTRNPNGRSATGSSNDQSGGTKTVTAAQVRQYAAEHGIDEDTARGVFVNKNYVIVK